MKFKVGDRVRLLKNKMRNRQHCPETEKRFQNEEIGVIRCILDRGFDDIGINFSDGYRNCYCYEDEIEKVKLTKEELLAMPVGTKIITDDETNNTFVFDGVDSFCGNTRYLKNYEINEDLTVTDEYCGTRIIEVQIPNYETIYKADAEVKEMTMADLEKELGYPVKIIKEKED